MWLAIDTATDRASVALGGRRGGPVWEHQISGARRHAGSLLPAIEDLLRQAGRSLDDLEGIALSDGPGSFTGLRVGAAVAKALVHSRGLELWVAPSLLVRAAGAPAIDGVVLSFANALRGDVYAAGYRLNPEQIETSLAPGVYQPAALISNGARPSLAIGEAPPEILSAFENWVGRPVITGPRSYPAAVHLLELVGRPGGAARVEAVAGWEPVYGRPAEAQVRWESAHGRPLPNSIGSPG
jgi:tRNA threonylcarbamoyladenosine biosynthesis protein TsaB